MRGDFPGKEMFSLGSLWLIFLLQTGAALEYPELYTHSARMGSDTTIPCQFNVDAIPPARRSFTMLWHFQEKEIFRSPNAPKAADPRLSIDQDRIQDGIADLSMSRVSIADGGLYICSMVQTPERKVVKEIRLDIHAPPQIIITNKTALINIESVLRCAISGFYPVDIDIKWLRDGEIMDNVIMEIPQRDPDGTYSVNSSVTITPTEEDRKRIFSYRIQHESLTAPFQEDFRLVFGGEEITKQNIIIISVAGGVVIIGIITGIVLCKKRGRRRKKAETGEDQSRSLVSSGTSGDVRQPPDSITNTYEESTGNQQHGPPEEKSRFLITGTNPVTTPQSSGDVRQPRDPIYNTNKTSIRNPQPEPREGRNHSQRTGTRSALHRKPPDPAIYNPGNVRQPRDSINNTKKTSIRNQQPEPREGRNNSQKTDTKSAAHRKPPDRTVSSPGGRRSDEEAENQDNENHKLTSGDESGDVRGTPHSIYNTNKTSIRNQQPEPREGWNNSQMTGTRSAIHREPPDRTVSSPGDVQKSQQSIRNTNKTFTSNQHPEHREERNQSQTTAIRSVIPPKASYPVSTPGNPSLENQRPEHHQTMPEDQETKPSANSQEEETKLSKGNVKNKVAMYQNNHISKEKESWRQQRKVKSKI